MAKKIIIVDDDLYIRELYEEIFKEEGFEVTTAVDGLDGFDKIKNGSFDLVLLDIMMPKLDGIGVLNKLAEDPQLSKDPPPVILLTNLAHDPVIKEALQKGARSYLIKADLTPDQVVNKAKEFLK